MKTKKLTTNQIMCGVAKLRELPELKSVDDEDLGWTVIHIHNAITSTESYGRAMIEQIECAAIQLLVSGRITLPDLRQREQRRREVATHATMNPEKACAEFVQWALTEGTWRGCDLEGGSIQEKALALGLLQVEPYDPDQHGESEYDVEVGGDWYTLADGVQQLLKK